MALDSNEKTPEVFGNDIDIDPADDLAYRAWLHQHSLLEKEDWVEDKGARGFASGPADTPKEEPASRPTISAFATKTDSTGHTTSSFSVFTIFFIILALFGIGYYTYFQVQGATTISNTLTNSVNLENGLVGHWTFDGADMTTATATDSSGNAKDASVVGGASPTIGKVGQAMFFDGVDDVIVRNAAFTSVYNTFSMSLWVRPTATHRITTEQISGTTGADGGLRYAIMPEHGDVLGSGYAGAGISVGTNGVSVFEHDNSYLPSPLVYSANLSGWNHITVVYNNKTPSLYLNGVLVRTGLTSTRDYISPSAYFGGSVYGFYQGNIDDVRFYNRVLSAKEIEHLYKLGEGTKISTTVGTNSNLESGLVGHFTFDGPDMDWASSTGEAENIGSLGGRGNVTNFTNSQVAIGKLGQALGFDGTNDYVSVTHDAALDPTFVTVAAWVKTDTEGGYIIAKDPPMQDASIEESVDENAGVSVLGKLNLLLDYSHEGAILIILVVLLLGVGMYKTKNPEPSSELIIASLAFSGAAALIYEIASTQALTYFFNSSSYSVATVIISFLLGLAFGSFLIARYLPKITEPVRVLMLMQVLAGLYAFFVLPQYGVITQAFSFLYEAANHSFALVVAVKFLVSIVLLSFPTVMLGASFPLASSLIIKDIRTAGSMVGKLYAWDLVGAVLGATLAGFVLLPLFGLTVVFVSGAVLNLIAWLLIASYAPRRLWLILGALAILIPLSTWMLQQYGTKFVGTPMRTMEQVTDSDILFLEETPYGEILVTNTNDRPTLSISKVVQCSTDYPVLLKNLDLVLGSFSRPVAVLDIGLGCGYSADRIASSSQTSYLDVVEINPVLRETLQYFDNESLLQNDRVTVTTDDALHFLARTQKTFGFINVELNMPSLSEISPFYSVEYFDLVQKKLEVSGTARIWVCCGDYEFIKTVYKTLRQVFPDIVLKTDQDPRPGQDYYYNTEFIVGGAAKQIAQTDEERVLQKKLDADRRFTVSTLDNQLIGKLWSEWSQKNFREYFGQPELVRETGAPTMDDAYVFPLDVKPGDLMRVGVRATDENGIASVRASFPYEGGEDWVDLELVEGSKRDGTWKGVWHVHDTIDTTYQSRVIVSNNNGVEAEQTLEWSDFAPPPVCASLYFIDSPYVADVGATVSVTVQGIGTCGGIGIMDDTSGSYVTIPSSDTDLDCNGDTCAGPNPLTTALRCQSAGVYNIKAFGGTIETDPTTVTCVATTPSVPYALSTVGGGQFVIVDGETTHTVTSSQSVTDNQWHLVVGTYDGTTMRIYVDGVQTGTNTSFSGNLPASKSGPLRVGADYQETPDNFFTGIIDDPRIYNRALSADEIAQLYELGGGSTIKICQEASVQDADGNTYNTLAIGSQCWLDRNMNVGTRINEAITQTNSGTIEKYCYEDNLSNCTTNHPNKPDGGFYQWNEAMQYSTTEGAQGICPAGFHIPSDAEWHTLEKFLADSGQSCSGTRLGGGCSPAGTKIIPGGLSLFEGNLAGYSNLFPSNRDTGVYLWSSSVSGTQALIRQIFSSGSVIYRFTNAKTRGLSVRCLQD